ncbi:protein kinase domain-containing protein [Neorhodopirellula pilleata]|nr:protein kinase [Neorhodopirellula pilleata]
MLQCPSIETLRNLIDDQLSAEKRSQLEDHINNCADCQANLDHLSTDGISAIRVMIDQRHSSVPDRAWTPALAKRLTTAVRIAGIPQRWTQTSDDSVTSAADTKDSGNSGVETNDGDDARLPETIAPSDDRSSISGSSFSTKTRISSRTTKIDDYEIVGEIARGGMGIVYKAWDVKLKCFLALKTIVAGDLAGERNLYRFQREAEATAKLRHPNIVRIHRIGECNGLHYFTMDLITGPTLQHLAKKHAISEADAVRLTIEICDAIAYAHQNGVLHRDLKPSNVLTDESGRAMVTDFGLAKCLEDDVDFSQTGQAIGTPSYMPPEQASGRRHEVGFQSDVYSIGAMLYHLLVGRPPFIGESHHDILDQVINTPPTSLRKLSTRISGDLNTICLKCLEKDRFRRYQSAIELRDDLRRFAQGFPIQARPVSSLERVWRLCSRNRTVAVLTIAIILVMGFGVTTTFQRSTQVKASLVVRLDAAKSRLDAEIESAEYTHVSSHDELVPRRVRMDVEQLQGALDEYGKVLDDWNAYHGQQLADEERERNIAEALFRVAQASRLLGDFDRSELAFMKAIDKCEHLVKQSPETPVYAMMWGKSLDYLGELYRDHDRFEDAEKSYDRSLQILFESHKRFPDHPETTTELARTHNNSAILLEDVNRLDPAQAGYYESEKLLRKLLASHPDNSQYQRDLARTLVNIGRLHRVQEDYLAAEAKYREAARELQSLVSRDPQNRRLEFLLAVTERNLGYLLFDRIGDWESGASWLTQASVRFEELPRNIPEYQLNRVICLVNLTSLYGQRLGDDGLQKCIQNQEQSLRTIQKLTDQYPGIAEYESWMGVVLGNGAAIAQIQGQKEATHQLINEAIEHQTNACRRQPHNLEYKNRLLNHHRFAIAVSLSRETNTSISDTAEPFAHLEKAIELGYRDVNELKTHSMYQPLRKLPRFEEAIERIEAARGQMESNR